ncbi:MAG: SPOR domain-containing protein [Croceibacterium sp.]
MTGGGGGDEADELAFAQPDARLPWLEADEDFDESGAPAGRVTLTIVALLALAAIAGGGYWLLDREADSAVVADGSTIEAPEGPYKFKPDDPGGTKALGTGDSSFAVAEGRSPATRVAASATAAPAVAEPGEEDSAASGGVGVQVGAYASRDRAELGWQTLVGRHEALQGVSHRVVQGTVDGSTVYRLQAVAGTRAGARELCDRLKANGADCQVKN